MCIDDILGHNFCIMLFKIMFFYAPYEGEILFFFHVNNNVEY